ncbi:hypothetical protein [Bartonella senegalensis]
MPSSYQPQIAISTLMNSLKDISNKSLKQKNRL